MDIEKKLDILLDYYRKNKSFNDNEWQIVANKVDIDLHELQKKLEKDELIILRDDRKSHQLTIEGQLFEGYTKKKNRNRNTNVRKFAESMILILGSLGAFGILILELMKYFQSCQCH